MMRTTLITLCFLFSQLAIAEVIDSTSVQNDSYYTDYSDQFLLKVGTVIKSNRLEIKNNLNSSSAKFAPSGRTGLGFGVNYKWLGLGIAFGLPASDEVKRTQGETSRFDAQLNIYSKKFGVDVFFQNYSGFHVENPEALTDWNKDYFPQQKNMQAAALGASGYYFFNNEKFSYKAAYVRNTVQNKSAGSFLVGGFFSLDHAGFSNYDSIISFVPSELTREVQDSFDIKAFSSITYGISVGYTHTFVFWKRCFINLSFAPGFGAKNLTAFDSNGENQSKSGVTSRLTIRGALGIEGKKFIFGMTSYLRTAGISFNQYELKPSTSNARFFIAKRFDLGNSKKK